MVNTAGTAFIALMRRQMLSLIRLQWVILGLASARGIHLQRAFISGQHMIDGDIAIGVAVQLDAGAIDLVGPGIEVFLVLGEIAIVWRRDAYKGVLMAMVRSEKEPSTVCSEVAPSGSIRRRGRIRCHWRSSRPAPCPGLIADTVKEIVRGRSPAAAPSGRRLVMMNGGEAIFDELPGDEGQPIPDSLCLHSRPCR